jgi:meso-butanediol dehydrogenase/(S,S)-butanediol dehydrogenase/diacetyl reductase
LKHGVVGQTKNARLKFVAKSTRINVICPDFIETPIVAGLIGMQKDAMAEIMEVPMGRLGKVEKIADTAP